MDGISGVQMGPGATLLTRIPLSPNSCARLARKLATAALVAAYGARAARLKHRVRAGGHHVPDDKIRKRQRRLWTLVAEAMPGQPVMATGLTAEPTSGIGMLVLFVPTQLTTTSVYGVLCELDGAVPVMVIV